MSVGEVGKNFIDPENLSGKYDGTLADKYALINVGG
jgi:hypothetical protein